MKTFEVPTAGGGYITVNAEDKKSAVSQATSQGVQSGDPVKLNTPAPVTKTSSYSTDSTAPTTKSRPIYTNEPDVVKARSVDDIQNELMNQAQGEIDNLNSYYNKLKEESRILGDKNMRRTNAMSALTGLSGSTEANVAATETDTANKADLNRIENERFNAVQATLGKIRASAVEQARQERLDAQKSEEERLAFREKAKADAVEQLSLLSKSDSGATIEGLKSTLSSEEYKYLIENAGGEEMAKAILFDSRPQNKIIGKPEVIGGKLVQAFQTPDGRVKYENVDLPEGVDPVKIKSVLKTDQGVLIIKEDGTYSTIRGTGSGTGSSSSGKSINSGGVTITADQLKSGEDQLQAALGPDGYIDPAVYKTAYDEWPGLKKDFLNRYPPNNYVNPENTDLPQYLRSTKKATPKTSSSGRQL